MLKASWFRVALGSAAFTLAVGWSGCSEAPRQSLDAALPDASAGQSGQAPAAAGGAESDAAAAGASGAPHSSHAGSYADGDSCLPGLTRCHGQLGYQSCTPEGVWGASQTCGGYSENGTSSYCAQVVSGAEPWAACVDPACWWWIESGLLGDAEDVGVCVASDRLRPCHENGILSAAVPCDGVCRELGELDGRRLGYCDRGCQAGERECLAGPLYRECEAGTWSAQAKACEGGEPCLPVSTGELATIKCGGPCEVGTSRCDEAGTSVETCVPEGEWQTASPCLLGRCVRAGAQAQCQTECQPGERACAFDGDGSERLCSEVGLWSEALPCETGSTCRVGTSGSLGCLACVGSDVSGGNAWGVADSFCDGAAVSECGADNAYLAAEACADAQSCVEVERGAARLAYCH